MVVSTQKSGDCDFGRIFSVCREADFKKAFEFDS